MEENCLAGSDLYLNDGGDISLLVSGSTELVHQLFRGIAEQVSKLESAPEFEYFNHKGVDCVAVTDPESFVRLYSANPIETVHIRSNSRAALMRIIDAITDGDSRKLGTIEEFAFVRTLMPWDSEGKEGDVFIYFSDPFIRNLVGPRIRIAQRRRKICHSHLKMIDSSVLLYCAQERERPSSLDSVVSKQCIPSCVTTMKCPEGGTYSLDHRTGSDLPVGICSFHGTSSFMKPCIEIPVETVTAEESKAYKQFVDSYNQYWRTYFDPIGIRLTMRDREYVAETVVLPLIDNSIYTGLSSALGRESKPCHNFRTPNTIFGTTVQLNKELLSAAAKPYSPLLGAVVTRDFQYDFRRLLTQGVGNQLSFHVCDAQPTFSLDIPMLMGMVARIAVGTGGGAQSLSRVGMPVWTSALVASLQMPVYLAVDVCNGALVDQFMDRFPSYLRQMESIRSFVDYSKLEMGSGRNAHMFAAAIGPLKFRLFVERIGNSVYVATQPQVLDQLWKVEEPSENDNHGAHALLTLTPSNWNAMRAEACLTWRERNRQSCHRNLGYLTAYGRALNAVCRRDPGSVLPGDLAEA
ncbi:MAG: hypothetical protein K2Z81_24460, partial [Cyanobacteria bacterium]|nr:hypothetical protein [Cyanobacteriota bacterium]